MGTASSVVAVPPNPATVESKRRALRYIVPDAIFESLVAGDVILLRARWLVAL